MLLKMGVQLTGLCLSHLLLPSRGVIVAFFWNLNWESWWGIYQPGNWTLAEGKQESLRDISTIGNTKGVYCYLMDQSLPHLIYSLFFYD